LRQTWRWFGPNDPVSIYDIRQAGAQGVVSALHHLLPGQVWSGEEIAQRQRDVAFHPDKSPSGIAWDVVESLPVSEDIKRQTGNFRDHIAAYKTSMLNLAKAGLQVICYNFMPVLDWTRTDLAHRLPNGATCMRFDWVDFAVYDIHILCRRGAADSFPPEIVEAAKQRFAEMSDGARAQLTANVTFGLPGTAETRTLDDVRAQLANYDDISEARLAQNLIDFLSEVAPVAQELGLRLCCHPDDPPFPLLGLPRVMSTEAQYQRVLDAVDLPANGVTLCAGSLGTRPDNDLPGMMRRLGPRVHFLHLRNVQRESPDIAGSFHEAAHLEGGTDMVALIAAILREETRRKAAGRSGAIIPMRPDHGQNLLDDLHRRTQPGYPAIGRLRGLAELRGIEHALSHVVEGLK
jgi:mannonate dehydratase